jgi:hypothetical protein
VEEEEIKLISENHQDLGGIPIMVGGEKLFREERKKNIKNSFHFACHRLLT